MNFFILGDSWGVGEWVLKDGIFSSIPDTGIEFYLTKLGHNVTNISAGSAGNFGQLRHAYWTLKDHAGQNLNYNYIIWFHTESIRDIQEIVINDPAEGKRFFPDLDLTNFEDALDYMDMQNYKYAQMIFDEFQIPFIVVGGQCTVNASIDKFSFAHIVIKSWLAELLDLDFVPPKNTFFSWIKIKKILDYYNIEEKQFIMQNIEILDQAQLVQQLAIHNENFPDNGHPARHCYQQLANRILREIS